MADKLNYILDNPGADVEMSPRLHVMPAGEGVAEARDVLEWALELNATSAMPDSYRVFFPRFGG